MGKCEVSKVIKTQRGQITMEINARNGTEQKEIEMERRLHERVGERERELHESPSYLFVRIPILLTEFIVIVISFHHLNETTN